MDTLLIAILAGSAMLLTDIIAVVQTMAEARNRGWLAGWMDVAGWIVGITTLTLSINAINSHDFARKALVVVLVSAANLFGTKIGQMIGSRWVKNKTIEERLQALERAAVNK